MYKTCYYSNVILYGRSSANSELISTLPGLCPQFTVNLPFTDYSLCSLFSVNVFIREVCSLCSSSLLANSMQGGALLNWRLDAKRPYLLLSSKQCGPWSSRTEGHHGLSSAR